MHFCLVCMNRDLNVVYILVINQLLLYYLIQFLVINGLLLPLFVFVFVMLNNINEKL